MRRSRLIKHMFAGMEYGFKRRDFLAFFLFPRVWKEIDRLRTDLRRAQQRNKAMQDMILNNYMEDEKK